MGSDNAPRHQHTRFAPPFQVPPLPAAASPAALCKPPAFHGAQPIMALPCSRNCLTS